jgi:hypothetical protein
MVSWVVVVVGKLMIVTADGLKIGYPVSILQILHVLVTMCLYACRCFLPFLLTMYQVLARLITAYLCYNIAFLMMSAKYITLILHQNYPTAGMLRPIPRCTRS